MPDVTLCNSCLVLTYTNDSEGTIWESVVGGSMKGCLVYWASKLPTEDEAWGENQDTISPLSPFLLLTLFLSTLPS